MSTVRFSQPVTILVGLGFPCRMRTANAAFVYLQDRPIGERDEAWEAAVEVCREAMAGKASGEEARAVFAGYALRRDILIDEPIPPKLAGRSNNTST